MASQGTGKILEASCLQAEIVKKSEHSEWRKTFLQLVGERGRQNTDNLSGLQNGVQVMIFVAFIIVALVVIYAILYQVVLDQRYTTSESNETAVIKNLLGSEESLVGCRERQTVTLKETDVEILEAICLLSIVDISREETEK